jgi:hypothetical protein
MVHVMDICPTIGYHEKKISFVLKCHLTHFGMASGFVTF